MNDLFGGLTRQQIDMVGGLQAQNAIELQRAQDAADKQGAGHSEEFRRMLAEHVAHLAGLLSAAEMDLANEFRARNS